MQTKYVYSGVNIMDSIENVSIKHKCMLAILMFAHSLILKAVGLVGATFKDWSEDRRSL